MPPRDLGSWLGGWVPAPKFCFCCLDSTNCCHCFLCSSLCVQPPPSFPFMESAVKSAFGVPVKQLFSCISADRKDKDFQTRGGFTKGPEEHHNRKAQEEK